MGGWVGVWVGWWVGHSPHSHRSCSNPFRTAPPTFLGKLLGIRVRLETTHVPYVTEQDHTHLVYDHTPTAVVHHPGGDY